LDKEKYKQTIKRRYEVYKKIAPMVGKSLSEFFKNKEMEDYLLLIKGEMEKSKIGRLATDLEDYSDLSLEEFLTANPKTMSLNARLKFNIADMLIKAGVITIDNNMFNPVEDKELKEDPVQSVKNIINSIAAHSRIVVWDKNNIKALVKTVENYLNNNNEANNIDKKIYQQYAKEGVQLDLKLDLTKDTLPAMQSVFTSVLDALEDVKVVDRRLIDIIDFAYNYEITEKQIKAIKEKLKEFIENIGNVLIYDARDLAENKDYYINKQGIYDPSIKTATEGYVNLKDLDLNYLLSTENIESISTADAGMYLVNLINSLIKITQQNSDKIDTDALVVEPVELETKYQAIKSKVSKESPLVDMIYNIMHKIGSEADKTVVAWLVEKGQELRDGTLDLTKHIDTQILNDF
jgi:hypothetical protein